MKKILVVNPKGGCGKTTITTSLASYYALWEVPVAIIDLDPQQSSLEWLDQRGDHLSPITGIDGSRGKLSVPSDIQRVVMDAPARTTMAQLRKLFESADVVLVPVLPSPIDIRAAARFVAELLKDKGLQKSRNTLPSMTCPNPNMAATMPIENQSLATVMVSPFTTSVPPQN